MIDTERALNVWASAIHHRAGGADGHPAPSEVHKEPSRGSAADSAALSSARVYDATKDKYGTRGKAKVELRVAAMIEAVERALAHCGATESLRRYLLFKYPTRGRFSPLRRAAKDTDPLEDPAAAFVASGHWDVLGAFRSAAYRKFAMKALESAEREFLRRLKVELLNGQRLRPPIRA